MLGDFHSDISKTYHQTYPKHGKHINRQHQFMELSWEIEKMLTISMGISCGGEFLVEFTMISNGDFDWFC
jgi:hypothetical protein